MSSRRSKALILILVLFLALALAVGYALLSRQVRRALAEGGGSRVALHLTPVPPEPRALERWGSGEVAAVALGPNALFTAGGFGVREGDVDLSEGLSTLKACAVALWRGRPVAGLEAGGVFLRRDGRWEAFVSGFGVLHPRVLLEAPGGELLIGAREGLFRAGWGAGVLERLDRAPVRSLALGEGGMTLAGGEEGLRRLDGARLTLLATPDPWIDWVGCLGREVVVLGPMGLARGPLGGALTPVGGGEEARSATLAGAQTFAVSEGRLLRFEADRRGAEERLPVVPRRVLSAGGFLFADTDAGLFRRTPGGWALAQARPSSLPVGSSHVSALALFRGEVVLGLFDGGLVVGGTRGGTLAWSPVAATGTWGVNALLPSGGALYVASLRGAARFDGTRLTPLEGDAPGAAFALAATGDGIAVGYAQGVLLPGARLLSAFHGLPGNQALALAGGEQLFVGTPSGLGAIAGGKVAWRVTAGEGRLPHPWITALALHRDGLFVGTYGGGVVRRTPSRAQSSPAGVFQDFPETGGMKINAGCLVEAGGRLYLGTDGQGLFRLSEDGRRFRALRVALPSSRVTAILALGEHLLVGTDEGLARLPLTLSEAGD
jgi:hypothetical protein